MIINTHEHRIKKSDRSITERAARVNGEIAETI